MNILMIDCLSDFASLFQLFILIGYTLLTHRNLNFSKGKHSSIAKTHLDLVVGHLTKIDSNLGNLASKSKPGDARTNGTSKKNSSEGNKKRKSKAKESSDSSPKKKAKPGNNSSLTLSQREERAMEVLATYIEDRGGMLLDVIGVVHVSTSHNTPN